jgi:23S rRNA pseudouridine1911/1915/1917 synthase
VDQTQAGTRLDVLAASEIDHCSRSFAASLIRQGASLSTVRSKNPGYPVKAGETVSGDRPTRTNHAFMPEDITLQILYEDDELIVVNKAPGMVVHPSPGHSNGTLVNALMYTARI